MLEKLFESLDAQVFTDELKESLETSFNEAVEVKAIEIASIKIDEKVAELSEKAEEFETNLSEEATAKEALIMEQVDTYLEKVVEEFITEAKESLDNTLVNEKADLMIEAFDAMLVAGGVDVQKIVEAKETSDVEAKLEESVQKYDTLIEENIAIEKENHNLIKMGVISEMKESLTLVEAEKFAKLADIVEFSKDEAYASKLEVIKESVKGTKVASEESITENTKKVDAPVKPAYSHLI